MKQVSVSCVTLESFFFSLSLMQYKKYRGEDLPKRLKGSYAYNPCNTCALFCFSQIGFVDCLWYGPNEN